MDKGKNRGMKFAAALVLVLASGLFVWQRASSQIAPAPPQTTIRMEGRTMHGDGPGAARLAGEAGSGPVRMFAGDGSSAAGEPGAEPMRVFRGDSSGAPQEGQMRMGQGRGETTPEQREQTRQAARQRLMSDPNSPFVGMSPEDRAAFLRKLDAHIEAGKPVIIEGRGHGPRTAGR